MIPKKARIQKEIRTLRRMIESDETDLLECRLAQVAEDTLRWATEDTEGWPSPSKDVVGMAKIVRSDISAV